MSSGQGTQLRSSDVTSWFSGLGSRFSGQILFDEPLSRHTYYRIGGAACVLAIPKSVDDLKLLAQGIAESGAPFFIMGQGSNLLASDSGFDGIVVRANKLNLDWKRAEFRDAKQVYFDVYGIDLDKVKELAFDKSKPRQ